MVSAPPPVEIPVITSLPLVIETQRLRLRPFAEGDVDDLWPHVSNHEVAKTMAWAAHRDKAETLEWIRGRIEAWNQGKDLVWAIEHEGRACGTVALIAISWTFRAWRVDRAELGYWIGQPLWGQGLMTEAATAVTRWGFETLGLHKITVGCIEGNHASKRIIEKLGYRYLSRLEDDAWRDGAWWNHLRYEMLASEWTDSTRTLRFNRPRQP
jgi:ribosomal-protein-alanine N-acetyltransferase